MTEGTRIAQACTNGPNMTLQTRFESTNINVKSPGMVFKNGLMSKSVAQRYVQNPQIKFFSHSKLSLTLHLSVRTC